MRNHNKKKNPNYRHGYSNNKKWNPIYTAWNNMKARCDNPKAISYKYCGAKGITYDIRWHFFKNFLEDMGKRPKGLTLDRIDGTGNYSKENCRWTDRKTQSLNRNTAIYIEYKGKKERIHYWTKKFNISERVLYTRVFTYKWDIKRALLEPVNKTNNPKGINK